MKNFLKIGIYKDLKLSIQSMSYYMLPDAFCYVLGAYNMLVTENVHHIVYIYDKKLKICCITQNLNSNRNLPS